MRKLPKTFDKLVLNANLVIGTPAACASLVFTLNKPYWIDPFTHAFCAPPRFLQSRRKDKSAAIVPKRTFVALAESYFGRSDFVGRRALVPADINPAELVNRVLKFQATWYEKEIERDQFIADSGVIKPSVFIAPYFPIRSDLQWLDVNIAIVRNATVIEPNVSTIVPISLGALNKCQDEIVSKYRSTGVRQVILWIESLDEDRADLSDLRKYAEIIEKFGDVGIAIGTAFGGFPSCLLQEFGLTSFTHGLVYGETKSFTPVLGGGQPPPRYYFRPGHVTMSVPDAELLLNNVGAAEYLEKICNCAICARLLTDSNGNVPAVLAKFAEVDQENKYTQAAYALSRFHFLLIRRKEVREYSGVDRKMMRAALSADRTFCNSLGASDFTDHLGRYLRLLADAKT